MIIYLLGEDRAYLSWLAHHRNGFVLDWLRKPTNKRPRIHRATCAEIRTAKTKSSHWTTARHLKACSLDLGELVSWAADETDDDPDYCAVCKPEDDRAESPGDRHLTKLGKAIVDYVVEAAIIHLDRHDAGYEVTAGDIAKYLDKTLPQISSALLRLAEDDYLRLVGKRENDGSPSAVCQVFPTADALRLVPSFAKLPAQDIEAELDHLGDEQ